MKCKNCGHSEISLRRGAVIPLEAARKGFQAYPYRYCRFYEEHFHPHEERECRDFVERDSLQGKVTE